MTHSGALTKLLVKTVYSSADGSWKMLSRDEWNLVDLTSSTLADADGDEKNSVQRYISFVFAFA